MSLENVTRGLQAPSSYLSTPDSVRVDPYSGAVKADATKNRLELLPMRPLEDIGIALTFGATKYSDHNWLKGMPWSRIWGALLRHLFAWWRGEDKDAETGLSHLAHAGCCLLFLMEYECHHQDRDDRPHKLMKQWKEE